jgi:hypothetical protein
MVSSLSAQLLEKSQVGRHVRGAAAGTSNALGDSAMRKKQVGKSRIILWLALISTFGLGIAGMPDCPAQGTQGTVALTVQIAPEATLKLTPLSPDIHPEGPSWYRVEIAIRMQPGATASLYLLSGQKFFAGACDGLRTASRAEAPVLSYPISRNGRYCVRIGFRRPHRNTPEAATGNDAALLLESTDQALRLVRSIQDE